MTYLDRSEFKDIIKLLCVVFIFGCLFTIGVFMWGYNMGSRSSVGYAIGLGMSVQEQPNNQTLYGKGVKK